MPVIIGLAIAEVLTKQSNAGVWSRPSEGQVKIRRRDLLLLVDFRKWC